MDNQLNKLKKNVLLIIKCIGADDIVRKKIFLLKNVDVFFFVFFFCFFFFLGGGGGGGGVQVPDVFLY